MNQRTFYSCYEFPEELFETIEDALQDYIDGNNFSTCRDCITKVYVFKTPEVDVEALVQRFRGGLLDTLFEALEEYYAEVGVEESAFLVDKELYDAEEALIRAVLEQYEPQTTIDAGSIFVKWWRENGVLKYELVKVFTLSAQTLLYRNTYPDEIAKLLATGEILVEKLEEESQGTWIPTQEYIAFMQAVNNFMKRMKEDSDGTNRVRFVETTAQVLPLRNTTKTLVVKSVEQQVPRQE